MEARRDAEPPAGPSDDPANDALRIQAAAIVAQQAALFERELRVQERETALARQEEQLAGHLEEKRRQLLDLQDQITVARDDLRHKRATLDELAEKQAAELAAARSEAADLLGQAKADRQRLAQLQRRLTQRRRRERAALSAVAEQLAAERARLQTEREQLAEEKAAQVGEIELDKRRLRDAWVRLNATSKEWTAKHADELADLHRRQRDLARRAKAIAAAEEESRVALAQHKKELAERRHEIEHLETRIGHARQRLLDAQSGLIDSRPVAVISSPKPSAVQLVPISEHRQLRTLAQIASELADQRLWLVEQLSRLAAARQLWITERDAAATELQALTAALNDREQAVARRMRDLAAAEQRLQADGQAFAESKLRIEAEHARTAATLAERSRELDRQQAAVMTSDRRLTQRELRLNELVRLWGRRRSHALGDLNQAVQECLAERAEWAAARDTWLREYDHAVGERRDLASRMLALEQARADWLDAPDRSPIQKKRLERLERHWVHQFNADVRELHRMRDTLAAEAARLDESAAQVRRERVAVAEQLGAADDRLAALEADRAALVTERSRLAESTAAERDGRALAENHVLGLRDEVEGLARLLIDAPRPIDRAA
jgi:chromosome segregation ATPase